MTHLENTPIFNRYFPIFASLLICLVGGMAYSNSLEGEFVFDDKPHLVESTDLHDITQVEKWWNHNPSRPIGYLTLALNYHFHGFNVVGYHVTNLVIHLSAAMVVFALVRMTFQTPAMKRDQTSSARYVPLFAALIFVSHPLQTQAVSYIIQRLASQATLFYLVTVALFVKARLNQQAKKSSTFFFVGAFFTGLLGMLTKQIVFTLPIMIGLYEFTFFRLNGSGFNWTDKRLWIIVCLMIAAMLIIPMTYAFDFGVMFGTIPPSQGHAYTLTPTIYLLTQFSVIVTYIRLLFLPINQNLDYDFPIAESFFAYPTIVHFGVLALIFAGGLWLFRRDKLLSFGIFWFFVTLSVESSVVPIGNVIFEHRLYLPLFGFALFVSHGAWRLIGVRKPAFFVGLIVTVTIALGYATYQRNDVWNSGYTLWSDAAEKSPNKARPLTNLGRELEKRGDKSQAFSLYRRAVQINPNYDVALNNLAKLLQEAGQLDKALPFYERALQVNPTFDEALYNIGSLWKERGDLERARQFYQQLLDQLPTHSGALNNMGNIYREQGDLEQATEYYRRACEHEIDPALLNLGDVYVLRGQLDRAFDCYRRYFEARPDFFGPLVNLGDQYTQRNEIDSARECYELVLSVHPKQADVQQKLSDLASSSAE